MQTPLAAAALTIFLAACGTVPVAPYQPPVAGSKARIKFYDDANRVSATIATSARCSDVRAAATWRWLDIPVGKRVYVQHSNNTGYVGSTCGSRFSFIPEEGASYISDLKEKVIYCTYEQWRQTEENGEKLQIPTLRKEAGCEPD